jgi:hypothetical protein
MSVRRFPPPWSVGHSPQYATTMFFPHFVGMLVRESRAGSANGAFGFGETVAAQ